MPINSEQQSIEDLKRRKQNFRQTMRHLSSSEKIAQLKFLQWRYYHLPAARALNGGREVPEKWRKWRAAQNKW